MSFDPSSLPALVSAAQGAKYILNVSERKYHYLRSEPNFPRPVELPGSTLRRWRTAELLAYVAALPTAAEPAPEPLKLRRGRNKRTGARS